MLYVLDEPSIGLHQRDNNRLLETLKRCDLGNSVVVVEHDEDAILCAVIWWTWDRVWYGGQVVAAAHPSKL